MIRLLYLPLIAITIFYPHISFTADTPDNLRDETVALLDKLPNDWPEAKLIARINGQETFNGKMGDPIELSVETGLEGSMSLVLVPDSGADSLVQFQVDSRNSGESGKINVSPELMTEPSMGRNSIYIVLTEKPIEKMPIRRAVSEAGSDYALGDDSLRLVKAFLSAVTAAHKNGHVAIAKLELNLAGYTADYIVEQFTQRNILKLPEYNILFATDQSDPLPESGAYLNEWGKALSNPATHRLNFEIIGHTDDVGSDDHNLRLSINRAEAVRNHLISRYGIDERRLKASGMGEKEATPEGTKEIRARDRKVEFKVIH